MKKIVFTLGFACFFGSIAIAQESTKVAAKKKSISLSASNAPISTADAKAEMEVRVQAKKKHYAEMQAAEAKQEVSNEVSANDPKGAKQRKSN